MNLLRSLLVSTHIHTALISRSGWNFFSPELRRNAIPHQTHANTEVKKAIEFFINTSITKPKTKTEAKISNPNEITMLTSMCTHTSKPLKMLTAKVSGWLKASPLERRVRPEGQKGAPSLEDVRGP